MIENQALKLYDMYEYDKSNLVFSAEDVSTLESHLEKMAKNEKRNYHTQWIANKLLTWVNSITFFKNGRWNDYKDHSAVSYNGNGMSAVDGCASGAWYYEE